MTKFILIASVAALAITAPAQAQREDRAAARAEKAQKAEAAKAKRSEQRATRAQSRPQAEQRVRAERPQRIERQRVERAPRIERQRVERAPRIERQSVERVRPQRAERQRVVQRAPRVERQRIERVSQQRVERQRVAPKIERQRVERVRQQRVERQGVERRQSRVEVARTRDRQIERQRLERRSAIEQRTLRMHASDRLAAQRASRQREQLAQRIDRNQNRIERRLDRRQDRLQSLARRREIFADSTRFQRPSRDLGERLNLRQRRIHRDWFDDFAAQRVRRYQAASPNYFYNYDYDDGYLYQVNRDNFRVSAMYPLLGGAFSTGRALPYGYDGYNVPYAYRSLYYDTPDSFYRYGDGGIYQVDSDSLMIQAVVALLTGQSLGIGQRLPLGYDTYNVPYAYRSTYFDSNDAWYRYDDGYIYQVDPYSRMIQGAYPVSYGGYTVGYPVPSYASYGGYTGFGGYNGYNGYNGYGGNAGYGVPYGYQNLYYGAPGYNYQYANNGIYQVDPSTQLISALVALVTGSNFGVGQTLPLGFDTYNVPSAYRGTYFDTDDSWYRYDDGTIYQVDPRSRLIQAEIPVSYDGYTVGYPAPAAYPGYAVPAAYNGLYYDTPGYDYRYFDGGIYGIDPNTQVVQSLAALTTGQTLGVGQMLPVGYDAYNVPYAYRDRYSDSDRYLYRYADGRIYQVDPQTRLIGAVIDAIV